MRRSRPEWTTTVANRQHDCTGANKLQGTNRIIIVYVVVYYSIIIIQALHYCFHVIEHSVVEVRYDIGENNHSGKLVFPISPIRSNHIHVAVSRL